MENQRRVIALGFFDGVHLGHRALLRKVRERAEGLEARLILQVHDELIVECPEEEAEAVCRLVEEEMEGVAQLAIPLLAETKAGKTWAEAH